VHACRRVTDLLGLVEGRDFQHVCLGETGFKYMIANLARQNTTYARCDIGVSAITASRERESLGITFSRATHRSALAVLVHAPLKQRGMWAFFEPLHLEVWVALVLTIVVTPFFVFFFESVFSKRCALPPPRLRACRAQPVRAPRRCGARAAAHLRGYTASVAAAGRCAAATACGAEVDTGLPCCVQRWPMGCDDACRSFYSHGGRLHILHGLTESMWHSISHTLSIDVFKVHSFPSRLITAAYAFLVLILTNTYTANLAAFLTVDQLDTKISKIDDLRGKAVVTIQPYLDRLYQNHRIAASASEGAHL
jgi:Ligand-gated ion channel